MVLVIYTTPISSGTNGRGKGKKKHWKVHKLKNRETAYSLALLSDDHLQVNGRRPGKASAVFFTSAGEVREGQRDREKTSRKRGQERLIRESVFPKFRYNAAVPHRKNETAEGG